MDTFPEIIRIKICDVDTGKPIEKIVLKIRLYANHKNDYNFILPPSDQNGCIEVKKAWLEEEIRKEQALFVMDYASDLNDCKPEVSLIVLDNTSLDRAIEAMLLYQEVLKISNQEIQKYRKASNGKYHPKKIDLPLSGIEGGLVIELKSCQ